MDPAELQTLWKNNIIIKLKARFQSLKPGLLYCIKLDYL